MIKYFPKNRDMQLREIPDVGTISVNINSDRTSTMLIESKIENI